MSEKPKKNKKAATGQEYERTGVLGELIPPMAKQIADWPTHVHVHTLRGAIIDPNPSKIMPKQKIAIVAVHFPRKVTRYYELPLECIPPKEIGNLEMNEQIRQHILLASDPRLLKMFDLMTHLGLAFGRPYFPFDESWFANMMYGRRDSKVHYSYRKKVREYFDRLCGGEIIYTTKRKSKAEVLASSGRKRSQVKRKKVTFGEGEQYEFGMPLVTGRAGSGEPMSMWPVPKRSVKDHKVPIYGIDSMLWEYTTYADVNLIPEAAFAVQDLQYSMVSSVYRQIHLSVVSTQKPIWPGAFYQRPIATAALEMGRTFTDQDQIADLTHIRRELKGFFEDLDTCTARRLFANWWIIDREGHEISQKAWWQNCKGRLNDPEVLCNHRLCIRLPDNIMKQLARGHRAFTTKGLYLPQGWRGFPTLQKKGLIEAPPE